MHLGDLHSVEGLLVGVLAFGPFLVVAAVATVLRHRPRDDEATEKPEPAPPGERRGEA